MANFKEVTIKGLEKDEVLDARKMLGNHLYYNSKDLTGSELGRKIFFSDGEIELTDGEKTLAKEASEQIWVSYVIRQAVSSAIG